MRKSDFAYTVFMIVLLFANIVIHSFRMRDLKKQIEELRTKIEQIEPKSKTGEQLPQNKGAHPKPKPKKENE